MGIFGMANSGIYRVTIGFWAFVKGCHHGSQECCSTCSEVRDGHGQEDHASQASSPPPYAVSSYTFWCS
jgi:hypothetical protein